MLAYLDSSVALHAILDSPHQAVARAFVDSASATGLISSRLLRTEMVRVVRREKMLPTAADPVLDRVALIATTDATFTFAESIGLHIATLDALHLATAALWSEPVVVATHDATMASVAEHLGLRTVDPLTT